MKHERNVRYCEVCDNEFDLDDIHEEEFIIVDTGEAFCLGCFEETNKDEKSPASLGPIRAGEKV